MRGRSWAEYPGPGTLSILGPVGPVDSWSLGQGSLSGSKPPLEAPGSSWLLLAASSTAKASMTPRSGGYEAFGDHAWVVFMAEITVAAKQVLG